MNLLPSLFVPLVVAGAVCFWCLVVWVIARIGGWHALATRFPAEPHKPDGVRMYQMEQLELCAAQYKGCASVGVAPAGLYLSVFMPFIFNAVLIAAITPHLTLPATAAPVLRRGG